MLLSFDPLSLLLWIILICFVPGAILSFSLFRKSSLLAFEKLFVGFGLGIILLPAIPFLLYMLAGIKFSYMIAVLSVVLLYGIAIAFFIRNKAYEGFKLPEFAFSKNTAIALIMVFLVLICFWVRIVPYSPVFFELDPYYYTDIAQQLLTMGENPVDDRTAWFPDLVVSHRVVPELSYLEALWYTFYSGGTEYDNLLLSVIASVYPPLAAALAVFFLYLFVSFSYRREWGVLAAGIAMSIPIFLFKTTAGVMEVQAYAFFALAFFLSAYAIMVKEKSRLFAVLAGIGYFAITLGSASEVVALAAMLIFLPLHSIFLFLKEQTEELREFVISNSIVFAIGPLLGGALLRGIFYQGSLIYNYALPLLAVIVFTGVLYALRNNLSDKKLAMNIFLAMMVVGLVLFFFTPLGDLIKNVGASAVSIAKYEVPLDRTIAEQHPAGADLSGSFGFLAAKYPPGIDAVMGILSLIVNAFISMTVAMLNWILATDISFLPKSNSLLLLWVAFFGIAVILSFIRLIKDEQTLVILFAAVVFPPFIIGIIKAKYTIYAGFLLAAGIGFIFGEAESALKAYGTDEMKKLGYYALVALAGLIVFLQFMLSAGGFLPAVLSQSFKTRFQDDPAAFAGKFQSICTDLNARGVSEQSLCEQYRNAGFYVCSSYDPPVCSVASDPVAFANTGTNAQYSRKLCYYSLISDVLSPENEELIAADFRCKRLSEYWVEAMEWIKEKTPEGSRFTSWWDYGHWTNFFGQQNTVLRNEHASKFLIGEVAHAYLDATPEELAAFMKSRDSEYAIFDKELTGSGGSFGGKYGALNYLMCARNNLTDVTQETGISECEADHLWETIFVPDSAAGRTCTISKAGNKTGVIAYKAYWTYSQSEPFRYTPFYPGTVFSGVSCYGSALNDPNVLAFCQNYLQLKPAYCIGEMLLGNGQTAFGTYYLNETYPNGDLKLNKAEFSVQGTYPQTLHLGDATSVTLFYTNNPAFYENGQIKSGYEDHKAKFYSSALYKALFLNDLPGFEIVFESKDKMVKIYRIK